MLYNTLLNESTVVRDETGTTATVELPDERKLVKAENGHYKAPDERAECDSINSSCYPCNNLSTATRRTGNEAFD